MHTYTTDNIISARKSHGSAMMATAGSVLVDGMDVSVLTLGVSFAYTIPSFSAIQVSLRQATIQVELSDGSGQLFDGFLQSHASLPANSSNIPFCIIIRKHCFVPVSKLD